MSSVNFPLSIIIFPNCSYALMLTNDLEDTRQPRTVVKKLDTRQLEILTNFLPIGLIGSYVEGA